MDKTLVVMAAGMGSRYGGLKQVDTVGPNGELIVDYSIFDAKRAGFNKVIFIIREENKDLFDETIGSRISNHIEVEYVFQELDNVPAGFKAPENRVKPWGTGHAVMSCLGTVNEPFAVINSDDFYGKDAFETLSKWMDSTGANDNVTEYLMVGYILKNTLSENGYVSRGVCKIEDELLRLITETTKIALNGDKVQYFNDQNDPINIDENTVVSMNCWGFTPDFLNESLEKFKEFLGENKSNLDSAEFYLPSIVQQLMDERRCKVRVLPTYEKWFGVTYKEDKPKVVNEILKRIQRGEYPSNLWNA